MFALERSEQWSAELPSVSPKVVGKPPAAAMFRGAMPFPKRLIIQSLVPFGGSRRSRHFLLQSSVLQVQPLSFGLRHGFRHFDFGIRHSPPFHFARIAASPRIGSWQAKFSQTIQRRPPLLPAVLPAKIPASARRLSLTRAFQPRLCSARNALQGSEYGAGVVVRSEEHQLRRGPNCMSSASNIWPVAVGDFSIPSTNVCSSVLPRPGNRSVRTVSPVARAWSPPCITAGNRTVLSILVPGDQLLVIVGRCRRTAAGWISKVRQHRIGQAHGSSIQRSLKLDS